MNLRRSFLLGIVLVLLAFPSQLLACACCADDGYYSISYTTPDFILLGGIAPLKPLSAMLYTTSSGDENLNGPKSDSQEFSVSGAFNHPDWNLTVTDQEKKSGTVELSRPEKMISFAVDLHDGRKGGGGGPLLYKEWRFKAKVKSQTGILAPRGTGGAEYFLVFQGRGNACENASDFTHWRLEVTGKYSNYAFFGEFDTQEQAETNPMSLLFLPMNSTVSGR